jgi:hypothetical protein
MLDVLFEILAALDLIVAIALTVLMFAAHSWRFALLLGVLFHAANMAALMHLIDAAHGITG